MTNSNKALIVQSNIFRPAAFWESVYIAMPDNSFFELLRSVFGKIKTPFNKQQLIKDLKAFLLREDIQKTIAAYIDETDAKIIAATALFGEPVLEQLENFFYDEFNSAELHDTIVNLEERFILYRFSDNHLALNPILKQILLPITANVSGLFPTAIEYGKKSDLKNEVFVIRPQATGFFITALFSDINLENILGALQVLGLFYTDNEKLVSDKKYFDNFSLLLQYEQIERFAAALLIYNELTHPFEILPPLFKNRIEEIANLIHSFLDGRLCSNVPGLMNLRLDDPAGVPKKTLKRTLDVLKSQMNVCADTFSLLNIMEKTGLITNGENTHISNKAKTAKSILNHCGVKSNFYSMLEKMQLSETERTELTARIDRKLVLCEAQLKDANIRYEKLEARHLDYTGKQNIAKQAISQQSPVEIVLQVKNKEQKISGIPQALEKEGNDLFLVIKNMRIPLAKISLLRRIKKSIFEK